MNSNGRPKSEVTKRRDEEFPGIFGTVLGSPRESVGRISSSEIGGEWWGQVGQELGKGDGTRSGKNVLPANMLRDIADLALRLVPMRMGKGRNFGHAKMVRGACLSHVGFSRVRGRDVGFFYVHQAMRCNQRKPGCAAFRYFPPIQKFLALVLPGAPDPVHDVPREPASGFEHKSLETELAKLSPSN